MTAATPSVARGAFGSRLGFVLAAAGSAIGLGNIWRFPYTAGESGGAAFVLVYLGFVALIGVPVLLAELALGRATGSNPVGAFQRLAPGPWAWVGRLGVLTGFGILSFYSVVAGWTLAYLWRAVAGSFSVAVAAEESEALFTAIIGSPLESTVLTAVFIAATGFVVRGGVSGGIERASKILMPTFFLLLLLLLVRSVTLPGAWEGIEFLLAPDFGKLQPRVYFSALGQALFSLSLGMGAMITYGSYLPKQEDLPIAGLSVAFFDTLIALMSGLIIFPALFSAGVSPSGGPGLVFVVLPTIFHGMPAGTVVSVAFYALLTIAALTSTMSLLEVVVAYFVDERGWSREAAVWSICGAAFALAVPSALSQGDLVPALADIAGSSFLDLQNIIFGNFALSIGAFFIAIFVGWRWGVRPALQEIGGLPGAEVWVVLIRFVCPLAVFLVFVFIAWTRQYF